VVNINGGEHAGIWSGSAASWEDLSIYLSGSWGNTEPLHVWTDGSTLYVAGHGVNNNSVPPGRTEAILWKRPISPWSVTSLHPIGADYSFANAVGCGREAGYVTLPGNIDHAALWGGTPQSWLDINPGGAARSQLYGADCVRQVGFAEIGNSTHAGWSAGSAASWHDLHPQGDPSDSRAHGIDGEWIVGTRDGRATLWQLDGSWVDLHPAGFANSEAIAVNGNTQGGYVSVSTVGPSVASLWNGAAQTWRSLHPAGFSSSHVLGMDADAQVGYADNHAGLWHGTASSWVDLNPPGMNVSSVATATAMGYQVGYASINGRVRAVMWHGNPGSWEDLSLAQPGLWGDTYASAIWIDNATIYVAGYGTPLTGPHAGNHEALLWTKPLPCYANCDGSNTPPTLNINDFICFQSRFAAGEPYANCDGSTQAPVLNVNDFICFQTRFAAGCP
jgi:hypothetical protein